jgi:hypothetical protein
MEENVSPLPKKFKTEVIKQGVGICLLGQIWNLSCTLPGKWFNHHGKVLRCTLLDELKQLLVSKRRGKLSKRTLFLQGNRVPTKRPLPAVNKQIFTFQF